MSLIAVPQNCFPLVLIVRQLLRLSYTETIESTEYDFHAITSISHQFHGISYVQSNLFCDVALDAPLHRTSCTIVFGTQSASHEATVQQPALHWKRGAAMADRK